MATDAKALLLTIQANTELLKSNLSAAERAIDGFAHHTEEELTIVDVAFERLGDKVLEHGAEIGGAIAAMFAIEAISEAIEKGLEFAASLGEIAQQLGVTAKDLQVFRYAASQVGISSEEMDKGLQKFTKSLGEARAGSETAGKIFKAIGFTDDQIKHLDVHDALLKTADGISAIGDRATRAVPETTLFGRAGQQLDTLFSGGAKGIDAFAASAEKLGLIIPDEFLEKAARAEHQVSELKQVLSVSIANVVAQNADSITTLAHALEAVAVGAAHAITRLTGFENIYHSEGLISALAASGAEKDAAGSNQGNLDRQRKRYEEARAAYHANPTSGPQLDNYTAAVGSFRDALKARQEEQAEDRAAEELAKQQGTGNGLDHVLAPKERGKSADELAKEAEEARKREVERAKRVADQEAHLDDEYLSDKSELTANQYKQNQIARERLAKQTKAALADVDAGVADGRIKAEEAKTLRTLIERNAGLQADVINQKEDIQDERDRFALANVQLQNMRDIASSQEALATTVEQRRAIELRILAAEKENERQQLQAIADDANRPKGQRQHTDEEIGEAKQNLSTLDDRYGGKEATIKANTATPMEAYEKQLKEETGSIKDQLQTLEVSAIQKLGDHFADAATKALHLHGVLGSIAGDLIKMAEKDLILQLLKGGKGGGGILGKLFGGGKAVGGNVDSSQFYVVGEKGPEIFAPGRSGTIIPNHSLPRAVVPPDIPSAQRLGEQRQQAMAIAVHVQSSQYFDAHVSSIADGRVNSAAPSIANAGSVKAAKDSARRRGRMLGTRG